MKNSPLMMAMLAAVCVLTFGTLVLAVIYEKHYRKLRVLQPQVLQVEANRNVIGALAGETIEYSKHNPGIDPILQQMGFKPHGIAPVKPQGK
jgi:hypothetical protein